MASHTDDLLGSESEDSGEGWLSDDCLTFQGTAEVASKRKGLKIDSKKRRRRSDRSERLRNRLKTHTTTFTPRHARTVSRR